MNRLIELKKNNGRSPVLFVKENLKYIIPLFVIIAGIYIMLAPFYSARQFEHIQRQALKAWENAIITGEIAPLPVNEPSGYWAESTVTLGDFVNEGGVWEEDTNPSFTLNYLLNNMEGVLTIEKIDFRAVILAPATKRNLDISVCEVISSRVMGQVGNYVLAGHYSTIYGRHFNRVREIGIGDIITVENGRESFDYQVTEIFSVEPSETWVMNDDNARRLITIITCDYDTFPYNRLIVRGEIKK